MRPGVNAVRWRAGALFSRADLYGARNGVAKVTRGAGTVR
jgi:hypothetical protein